MELDFSELREMLAVLNQTDIAELTLKSADFELTVRKGVQANGMTMLPDSGGNAAAVSSGSFSPPVMPSTSSAAANEAPTRGTPASSAAPTPTPTPTPTEKLLEVISPMVGTFYRSPAPDEAPFVDVGDRIQVGQTVCIIEAMKLMNELETEVSGEIVEILVQNAEPVEYGQPLMRVRPV